MSDSLRPHESQHARPPCPSPTPGVHSNSRPSRWWYHPAISSSGVPFSSCPQSLPASESFPMSQLFAWDGQSIGVSALASFLPNNFSVFSCKEYNQSDFGIDHLVMSKGRIVSCVVWNRCFLWPVCSLGKTLLAFSLLHSVLQGQICLLLWISLDFLLLHSSPLWWKGHLFWC